MTLVFPLLLGGLGLIAVPVLIHLILRQKPKTLKFPAFRFLVQRQRTNLRKLQLRHLLLLALRILLLLLICFALARPKIASQALNLRTDRPVAAVLLFDTSYSMEYKITGGQTRLADAQQRGLELLDQLPAGSKAAVLDTAEPAVSSEGEFASIREARNRIQALRLRYDSATVTARLHDAYRLFETIAYKQSDDRMRQFPRFLCIFSDGMQSSWDQTDVPKLFELQEAVPPSLDRMKFLLSKQTARLELLRNLRQKLPPPEGKDYPEQSLIDLWEKITPLINASYAETFPDSETKPILIRIRQQTRELLARVNAVKQDKLSETTKEYQRKVVESLHNTLEEMQGVYALFVNVAVNNPTDLALLKVEFPREIDGNHREIFTPGEIFKLRVLVQATGEKFEEHVLCEVGGKTQKTPLAIDKGEKQIIPFDINCKDLSPGPQQVRIRLSRPDLLDFTNRRFATFSIRQTRPLLIVTENTENAKTWKTAIEAKIDHRFRCEVVTPRELIAMKPAGLATFQAVYLFNVDNPETPIWTALKNYVDGGGNLAVIPGGGDMVLDAYTDKVARQILPASWKKIKKADPGMLWNWNDDNIYKHPFLKRFRGWNAARVDFIGKQRAHQIWTVEPQGDKTSILVRYVDPQKPKVTFPAVLERDTGKGKVVMLTTRMDDQGQKQWNNYLQGSSFYLVVAGELSRYLAGDAERVQFNFIGGRDVPRVKLPFNNRDLTFTLSGPNEFSSVARPDDKNELLFPKAVTPGNYILYAGTGENKDTVGAFSVNFPPAEAELIRTPPKDIEALLGRGRVVSLTHQMNLRQALQGVWSEPAELFPWLMIGLLLFLVLENLLSNLFYRRAAT